MHIHRNILFGMALATLGACGISHHHDGAHRRLFMDVHHLGPSAVTVKDVEGAHVKDLAVQAQHGVDYQEYWVDAGSGTIYCLVAAEDAACAHQVHKEAHGLLADELVEVEPASVLSEPRGAATLFMATWQDPSGAPAIRTRADRLTGPAAATTGGRALRYWASPKTGRGHALFEARDKKAVLDLLTGAQVDAPLQLHEVVRGK